MGVKGWAVRALCSISLALAAVALAGPAAAMDGIGHGPGSGSGSGGDPPSGFGQLYASLRSALVDDSRILRDAVLGRSNDAGAASGAGGWVTAHGGSERDEASGLATLKGERTDVLGGFDVSRGGWRFGLAAGGGTARWTTLAAGGDASVDAWRGGLWLGGPAGPFRVSAGAGYSHYDLTAHRVDSLGGAYRSAFSAATTQAFAEAALPLGAGPLKLEPYGQAAWVGLNAKGFAETGGTNAITGSGASQGVGFADLGLRLGLGGGPIRPWADVSWRHAWGDLHPVLSGQMAGSGGGVATSLGVGAVAPGGGSGDPSLGGAVADAGLRVRADAAKVKAGLSAPLGHALLSLDYDAVLARGFSDQGAVLRLSVRF